MSHLDDGETLVGNCAVTSAYSFLDVPLPSLSFAQDAFARTRRPEEFRPELLRRERLLVGSDGPVGNGLARSQSFESTDESPGSSSTPRSSAAYFEQYEAELEELRQEDLSSKTFRTSLNNLDRSASKNSMQL